MPATISQEKWIEWTVSEPRRIAVVGLSNREDRDSYRASFYLHDKGYDIIPVNPNCDSIEGLQCYPSLADIPGTIDIVNIFSVLTGCPPPLLWPLDLNPNLSGCNWASYMQKPPIVPILQALALSWIAASKLSIKNSMDADTLRFDRILYLS